MWGHRHWGGMRRGWLRPWIISMMARSPKNGAEIIDEVEKMSWGGWRPSPGSVYPLLDDMTQEGILKKRDDGRYELTEKGKEEGTWPFGFPFAQKPTSIESMVNEMRDFVSYFEDIAKSAPAKINQYSDKLKETAERLTRLLNQNK
jgi:DNA-binding PadR family transcriptional regulator